MTTLNLKKIYYIAKFQMRSKLGLLNDNPPTSRATKDSTVINYGRKYGCNIFVETGTYRGDLIEATKNSFSKIYSVELGRDLFLGAQKRFAGQKHIEIINGDSAKILPEILKKISVKAVFWLDAHHSGGDTILGEETTPVLIELINLLAHPYPKVILIDDARLFNGIEYPTIRKVKKIVEQSGRQTSFSIDEDIIRIVIK